MTDKPAVSIGHEQTYYALRKVHLDGRGGLSIDPTSTWGSFILVTTFCESPSAGADRMRPVTVGPHAYIGSGSLLYNCVVGEGAIVAAGTVLRSCEVAPWTMVAGNPPQVLARCPGRALGQPWEYMTEKWRVLT